MNSYPLLNIDLFNSPLSEQEFYVNIFSVHLETHHRAITVPHKHDFYLVVLFTQGTGLHEIDFQEYEIHPGSLFLMRPGQTHHWEFSTAPEGFIFFHSQEFYNMLNPAFQADDYPMFASSQNTPLVQFESGLKTEQLIDLMAGLYDEYHHHRPLKRSRIGSLIQLFYIETAREIWNSVPHTTNAISKAIPKIQQLERLINREYLSSKKASDYAGKLHVSTKHLNKLVSQSLGKTTTDLIHERVLLEAKRLLVRQHHTVQEIATLLGYDDPAYFTRLFKKKTGTNPSEFARKYHRTES